MKKKISNRINLQTLYRNLDNKVLRPVYFFTGDQIFLIEQAIDKLKSQLMIDNPDLNHEIFHGDTASADDIISLAETYPMFGSKRLILLKNAERLSAKDFKAFGRYFRSPSPFSCLVFHFKDAKGIDNKNDENIVEVDTTVDKSNLHSSIREIASENGREITREAISSLISLVGDNLQDISGEIEKLSLYTAGKKRIDARDVERITEKVNLENVFDLLNAVANKDRKKALGALLDLESKNEDPISILYVLSREFRLIWRVKELVEKRFTRDQIVKELKISPGRLYYKQEQAKHLTFGEIRELIKGLYEADRKLKTSYAPNNQTLTKLVLDICR